MRLKAFDGSNLQHVETDWSCDIDCSDVVLPPPYADVHASFASCRYVLAIRAQSNCTDRFKMTGHIILIGAIDELSESDDALLAREGSDDGVGSRLVHSFERYAGDCVDLRLWLDEGELADAPWVVRGIKAVDQCQVQEVVNVRARVEDDDEDVLVDLDRLDVAGE